MEAVIKPSNIVFNWIPLKRVGPFLFGDSIDQYCGEYKLKQIPEEYNEKVGWNVYRQDNQFSVFSEKGKVVAISCLVSCIYNDLNLIGIPVEKAVSILNQVPDLVETEDLSAGPQDVYDFDDLGLQLWVKDKIVVTAICNGPCLD